MICPRISECFEPVSKTWFTEYCMGNYRYCHFFTKRLPKDWLKLESKGW